MSKFNKLVATTIAGTFAAALAMPAVAGNGAPTGKHYNLNIIGMEKMKRADMNAALDDAVQGHNGHVIFVALGKNGRVSTKIWLTEGDFKVLDANGTDGEATFRLPANNCDALIAEGSDCTNETDYTVWARALGKPGGTANVTTCRTDTTEVYADTTVDEYCSTEVLTITSETGHGKKQFENVTKELTTICADYWDASGVGELGQDGICDAREQLFAYDEQYWWDYDNYGLRLAQLRFYERP